MCAIHFITSYKRLEKLCSEIYGDIHGITAYIDEMYAASDGSRYVPGWDEDLRQLKLYRNIRNRIVHEPDSSEEDLCIPEYEQWLDHFHSRIMSTSDPLALYRKAKNRKPMQNRYQQPYGQAYSQQPYGQPYPQQSYGQPYPQQPDKSSGKSGKAVAWIFCGIALLLIVSAAIILAAVL